MTLAQLGADVIRIDPVGGATDTRRLPLDQKGNSLYWAGLNKGKRSVELNTSSDEGRRLVVDLLRSGPGGGILLTNAVGQRWLDYEAPAGRTARPDHGPHPRAQRRQAGRGLHDQQRGRAAADHRPRRPRPTGQPRAAGLGPAHRSPRRPRDPGRRAGPGPHRPGPAGQRVAGQRGRGHHGPPRLRGRRGGERAGPAYGRTTTCSAASAATSPPPTATG